MNKRLWSEAIAALVIALLSLALSAYAGYTHNDKEVSNRVTAIETQQVNDTKAIEREGIPRAGGLSVRFAPASAHPQLFRYRHTRTSSTEPLVALPTGARQFKVVTIARPNR